MFPKVRRLLWQKKFVMNQEIQLSLALLCAGGAEI